MPYAIDQTDGSLECIVRKYIPIDWLKSPNTIVIYRQDKKKFNDNLFKNINVERVGMKVIDHGRRRCPLTSSTERERNGERKKKKCDVTYRNAYNLIN